MISPGPAVRNVLRATDCFAVPESEGSSSLKRGLLAAIGANAIRTGHGLQRESSAERKQGAWTSFNWDGGQRYAESMINVHVFLWIYQAEPARGVTAHAVWSFEPWPKWGGGSPGPWTIELIFPDEVLGLERLSGLPSPAGAEGLQGLYFNLTPGERVGNLFDVVDALCRAYARVESFTAHRPS